MVAIGDMIATEAETWLGTPFRWQAAVKGVGCDCKGLIAGIANACGRAEGGSLEALAGDYRHRVDPQRLQRGLMRLFDRVSEPETGDVLVLYVHGVAQHLAVHAPLPGQPMRAIQAIHTGPKQVVATGIPRAMIASIWRWRAEGSGFLLPTPPGAEPIPTSAEGMG